MSVLKLQEPQNVIRDKRMVTIPFPSARVPMCLAGFRRKRSYEEVARSLGFYPAELVRAKLLEFFETEGAKLYDYDQVSAWLTWKKERAGAKYWCWRPLREKDIISGYRWGYNCEKDAWSDGFYSSTKRWECRPIERLVLQRALEKIEKIANKFGDHVKFFVSDCAAPDADHFIMVRPAMYSLGKAQYNLIFAV